jgi:hypothetical protein
MRITTEQNPADASHAVELERIHFRGRAYVPEVFADGAALFDAVCEQELEGVVREAAERALQAGLSRLGEDEEPQLLAVRAGAGVPVQG